MKEFYAFDITIRPEQCPALIADLIPNTDSNNINNTEDQKSYFIETLRHINQVEALKTPSTTADVANNSKEDMQEVSNKYQEVSNRDACKFAKLLLNIDGKIYNPDDDLEDAIFSWSKGKIISKDITMDTIISYIEFLSNVAISDAQKNFLRTQWNHASLLSSHSSFFAGHETSNDPQKPNCHVFYFNKQLELSSVQFVSSHLNIDHDIDQSGSFTITADISNLKNISLEATKDPWLPKFSAKTVTISYASSNFCLPIDKAICNAVKKNAKFKQRSLLNAYLKAKAYIIETISSIANKFSKKHNIDYSLFSPSSSRTSSRDSRSSSLDSKSYQFTLRESSISTDSEDDQLASIPKAAANNSNKQKDVTIDSSIYSVNLGARSQKETQNTRKY